MASLSKELEATVLRGLDYVLEQQDAAGSWTDWALPPGPSSEWTTAYIGYRLRGTRAPFRDRLAGALALAAGWLLDHQFPDGGWGYNPTVESDADSTALAILFLSAVARSAPPRAYVHLRRFQRQDGGFSTFLPDGLTGSWGRSHPEITPVALLALLTDPAGSSDPVIDRGIGWIRRARRLDGTWNAFWWTTRVGASEANLAFLASIGCPEHVPGALSRMDPTDSLQSAMLLSTMAAEGWSPHRPPTGPGAAAPPCASLGGTATAPGITLMPARCSPTSGGSSPRRRC
jgi:squalene cyclase